MPGPAPSWRQADDDVFVATIDGEYAGFVGVTSSGVEAQTSRGEHLGVHRSLDLARAAVAASLIRPAVAPAGHPRPRPSGRRGTTVARAARNTRGKTRWPLAP